MNHNKNKWDSPFKAENSQKIRVAKIRIRRFWSFAAGGRLWAVEYLPVEDKPSEKNWQKYGEYDCEDLARANADRLYNVGYVTKSNKIYEISLEQEN
jgi:hypothetical protein